MDTQQEGTEVIVYYIKNDALRPYDVHPGLTKLLAPWDKPDRVIHVWPSKVETSPTWDITIRIGDLDSRYMHVPSALLDDLMGD